MTTGSVLRSDGLEKKERGECEERNSGADLDRSFRESCTELTSDNDGQRIGSNHSDS